MAAGPKPPLSILDSWLSRLHRDIVKGHPVLSLVASCLVYAGAVLAFAPRMAVSSNYLIILPVVVAAFAFELPGGILAGALGLPANLLLFAILGRPEFSPASKLAAEFSGLVLGGALGFLGDYFGKFEAELGLRIATEESLRRAVEEKEAILQELHHRVRNNLNVITSIIQLQRRRSRDPSFIAATDELLGRVFAIALVHDRLHSKDEGEEVSALDYLGGLATNIVQAQGAMDRKPRITLEVPETGLDLDADTAGILGMIANEAITNSVKHAFCLYTSAPAILVSFCVEGDSRVLRVEDNGSGFPAGGSEGLGLKIIRVLARQLDGKVEVGPRGQARSVLGDPAQAAGWELPGTALELSFPSLAQRSGFAPRMDRSPAVAGADTGDGAPPQAPRSRWTLRKGRGRA
jgi:two-component sensor histidine kinase